MIALRLSKFAFSSAHVRLNSLHFQSPNPSASDSLVVLHGLLGSSNNFRSIVKHPKISQKASSYLLDLRNHGESEHNPSMSLDDMAGDVLNFIQEKSLKDVYLMGHSLGARVVMSMVNN